MFSADFSLSLFPLIIALRSPTGSEKGQSTASRSILNHYIATKVSHAPPKPPQPKTQQVSQDSRKKLTKYQATMLATNANAAPTTRHSVDGPTPAPA